MATFVIGDIHGCHAALLQCLERCGFDNSKDTLISLGDIVDGGPGSFECVEELLKVNRKILIKGNHDDWLLEFIESGLHPCGWGYGGPATIKSYGKHAGKVPYIKYTGNYFKTSLNPDDIPKHHVDFFKNQVLYHIDANNNCFVHGGFNRLLPFHGQRPDVYFWDRDLWMQALQWQVDKKLDKSIGPFEMVTSFNNIFLGHTNTTYWKINKPMRAVNIYNLDTGSSKEGGRLTIMDVQTKKFWQSDGV